MYSEIIGGVKLVSSTPVFLSRGQLNLASMRIGNYFFQLPVYESIAIIYNNNQLCRKPCGPVASLKKSTPTIGSRNSQKAHQSVETIVHLNYETGGSEFKS